MNLLPISAETTNAPNNINDLSADAGDLSAVQLIASNINRYITASMSRNTWIAYQADLNHFFSWGGSIPCSPQIVSSYLAIHADKLSSATLTRRVISIKRAHTSLSFPSPTDNDLVKFTLKGIKRSKGASQRQVEPILKSNLIEMVNGLKGTKGCRDRALLLLGFAGGFRRSELVSLDFHDIEFVDQGLLVHLRRSKTDQEGQGRKIGIPFARGQECPVKALKDWMSISRITEGPIFVPINRHGKISNTRLSTQAIAVLIKKYVAAIGLDAAKFSGHSLRAGLVTSAAQAGVSAWKIKQQTGHKSDAMLNRYIRDARLFIDNAAGAIL